MKYETVTLKNGCQMDIFVPVAPTDFLTVPPEPFRPSIIICPGGGYAFRAVREGEPLALRFASLGFNTYVVHYRVAPNRFPDGLQDLACAVHWVRTHAKETYSHPDRIAVMGFSAGGHLAGSLGTMWNRPEIFAPLGLTCEDVKPNGQVLCYPVISGGEFAHRGSFENLTGSADLAVHEEYSLEKWAGPHTPPTFLWHTFNDACVPVENAFLLGMALRKAQVETEMHIWPDGPHGMSMADMSVYYQQQDCNQDIARWPEMAANFLRRVM